MMALLVGPDEGQVAAHKFVIIILTTHSVI